MAVNNKRRGKAFQAGRQAALEGMSENGCGEPRGTIYYDDWHDGHEAGKRELWLKRSF